MLTLGESCNERVVARHCIGLDHRYLRQVSEIDSRSIHERTFVQVRSHALVVAADQSVVLQRASAAVGFASCAYIYLVDASPVDSVEAQEAPRAPARVIEPEEREVLVLVELVLRTFGGGVCEVRARRAVPVPVDYRGVPQAEFARGEAVVSALNGEHGSSNDSVCSSLHISECGNLRKEVLKVSANTTVLVRRTEGDVVVRVQPWVLRREGSDDGTTNTRVTHRNIYTYV